MKIEDLYDIHDNLEAALRIIHNPRKLTKQQAERLYVKMWKAHDKLERVVIGEQAKRGKV